ncbi:MAG: mRNA surveillance protein pelota [Nanoarchaeota archaeon]
MRKLYFHPKTKQLKLAPDTTEDLWYLSTIIDPGDTVEAHTYRKMKVGDETSATVKKSVIVQLCVENIELAGDILRISGIIIGGSEELPRGVHHSIKLDLHEQILIQKQEWLSYHLQKIEESCNSKPAPIFIVLHDRDEAYIARMTTTGVEVLLHLRGEAVKKDRVEKIKDFYTELSTQLRVYNQRFNPDRIILASPAFFKEDFAKILPLDLKKKIIMATASSVSLNGIDEILKRDETKTVLCTYRIALEIRDVESLFTELATDGKAVYGWNEVLAFAQQNAIQQLLITESFIKIKRETKTYPDLDRIMRAVEHGNGYIRIISDAHEAGRKLNGIGGIAAILRYKKKFE